jgi:hypothetical protein
VNAVRLPTSAEHKAACAATYARTQADADHLTTLREVMQASANAAHLSRGYVPDPRETFVGDIALVAAGLFVIAAWLAFGFGAVWAAHYIWSMA